MYSKAIEFLEKSMTFTDHRDIRAISLIIDDYRRKIEKYSIDNVNTIIEPTREERGNIIAGFKKMVWSRYRHVSQGKLNSLVDNTNFSHETMSAKVLLSRRCNLAFAKGLDRELNEHLKLLMLNDFHEQNKHKLKHLKQYETS